MSCKPLLKWPGGKSSELSEITPRILNHTRYFEPFFGGGSVFFDGISKPSYVNDSHPDLMMFYEQVKTQNIEFFSLLDSFVDSWYSEGADRQSIYLSTRKRYNETEGVSVQKTVDFFILREYAYGGMFRLNSRGEFNVPFGHPYINKDIQKKIDYLKSAPVKSKLENTELHAWDFQEFVDKFSFDENDFMFVDPPYDCSFSKYDKYDFDIERQKQLANYLLDFKGKFMLVVQHTDLMKELYCSERLQVHTYAKKYRFNIKGRFNRSATHALITNY